MERRGKSGGLICIDSFLKKEDREKATTISLRCASILRTAGMKEGLQTLYADPDEVLKKYKDFDIAKAMAERKGKYLWVRARAIDADVVNANGDYFSKEELLKKVEVKGKKIPAYKTFEGVPIYSNHKNDDIDEARGMVVYAEWDEDENCVWCTFFVDETAYPHIAQGIRQGYIHDVSMGCQVESGTCSVCGNLAKTEKEYCDHMRNHKGKTYRGDKCYEKNHGLKFIELSVVGDGAFENCEIQEIYDADEIIEKALSLKDKAASINNAILVAGSFSPKEIEQRHAYENCLRQVAETTNSAIRLSQVAGTLVGGQLMAGEGTGQNTTVSNILQFLGIDATSGLNVLDMINLALNFLEVSVMNLFARKDNIDLAHVGKITKSMADLQSTMQDMIDEGVDTGGGGKNVPMNQQQLQQQQAPMQQAPQAGPPMDYSSAGNVGRSIGPMQTQNQAFMGLPMGIGGGVMASTSKPKNFLVWKSPTGKREVVASVKKEQKTANSQKEHMPVSIDKFINELNEFAQVLGIPMESSKMNIENRLAQKITSNKRVSGGTRMQDKDIFKQFSMHHRMKRAAQVSADVNVEDGENRIRISSDGEIKAYHKGQLVQGWEPRLSEAQYGALESDGGVDVVYTMLQNLNEYVTAAKAAGKTITAMDDARTVTDKVMEEQVAEKRTGTDKDVKERLLDNADEYSRQGADVRVREELIKDKRTGTDDDVKEHLLEDAGLYSRRGTDKDVKEKLIEDARLGNPTEVIELQLKSVRAGLDKSDYKDTVNASTNALAKAVVASRLTPEEVVDAAKTLSTREDLAELFTLAALGNSHRTKVAARKAFHKVASAPLTAEDAILDAVGNEINEKVTAADLAETIKVVASETDYTVKAVTKAAKAMIDGIDEQFSVAKNVKKEDLIRATLAAKTIEDENVVINREHVKAALSAFASSVIDTRVAAKEVIDIVSNTNETTLLESIELAKKMAEQRNVERERKAFWGGSQRIASKTDLYDNVVGWLADYASMYKVDNSAAIVKAAKRTVKEAKAAEMLINKMIKTSSVEVTEEETKTKRIVCTVGDLGGIDVKAPDFGDRFREKAIEILSNCGYTVDPATFNYTDLNVTASGEITASVTSRMSKTFNADAAPAPIEGEAMVEEVPGSETPMETQLTEVAPVEENDTVMTASAKSLRKASRQKILERFAQMPPMGGGAPAGGMGAPMGGAPSPMDGALGEGGDPISAFSTDDPMAAGAEGAPDADAMSEPGNVKPWGTVCPSCGGNDVDVANGEGKCNSCGSNITYKFIAEATPPSDEKVGEGEGEGEEMPEAPALGEDMGLGAATAPAPGGVGGGAAPAAPAPAPGVMAQASWQADSEVFIRVASKNFDRDLESALPVGFVCPACGNRHAAKHSNTTYCHECGTISKSEVTASKTPGKVNVSITWLI